MIKVNKLNKVEFYLNPTLIETVDITPDTVITLLNGKKYIIAETAEELMYKIQEYYKLVNFIPPHVTFSEYDFTGRWDDKKK